MDKLHKRNPYYLLVREVAERAAISQPKVRTVLQNFYEVCAEWLMRGDKVHMAYFGKLCLRDIKERRGRIGCVRGTSKSLDYVVPAHKKIVFKPNKVFIERVNNPERLATPAWRREPLYKNWGGRNSASGGMATKEDA